jgi:hypothetical protein
VLSGVSALVPDDCVVFGQSSGRAVGLVVAWQARCDMVRLSDIRGRGGATRRSPPPCKEMTMRGRKLLLMAAPAVLAVAVAGVAAFTPAGTTGRVAKANGTKPEAVQLRLTPSSAQLAQCMPGAELTVAVGLTTDKHGFDSFEIQARHLPPNREFTVFLLQFAGAPFGAAEYIGDFGTNAAGEGHNTFHLIVQEAFSSTLVNGQRVRVDLNQVGVWFADPKDDDFCLGPNSPVTPFDGDNEAGVQAFNSANTQPLPAP